MRHQRRDARAHSCRGISEKSERAALCRSVFELPYLNPRHTLPAPGVLVVEIPKAELTAQLLTMSRDLRDQQPHGETLDVCLPRGFR